MRCPPKTSAAVRAYVRRIRVLQHPVRAGGEADTWAPHGSGTVRSVGDEWRRIRQEAIGTVSISDPVGFSIVRVTQ